MEPENPTPTPTTTNTTTTTTTKKIRTVRFDGAYVYSAGGVLKMLQIIINLIAFILIQASGEHAKMSQAIFYCFVSGTGICISTILLLVYFVHIVDVTQSMIPWFKIELGYCLLWILFHLIAGLVIMGLNYGYFNTAGYFSFAAMAVYALEAFYKICSITVRRV